MELNDAIKILRSIAKNTTNAEVIIKLNDNGKVTAIKIPTDNANLAFFNGLYKVFNYYGIAEEVEGNDSTGQLEYYDMEEPDVTEESK